MDKRKSFSGDGIDSTVTALLLHEQGYEVVGITTRLGIMSIPEVLIRKRAVVV